MAKKRDRYLRKRGNTYYFRKGGVEFSLGTTVKTEAVRLKDRLIENYLTYGHYRLIDDETYNLTFGQVAKSWALWAEGKKVRHSTWRDYRSAMNKYVLPQFKDTPIREMTSSDVEDFADSLENISNKRINNILVPMRSVFKYAAHKDRRLVDENIMTDVENRTIVHPDIFPFTYDEAIRLQYPMDPIYRYYTIIRFQTGMRDGEINALEWTDYMKSSPRGPVLNINKSFVYGKTGGTKTPTSRRFIDCNEIVVEALEEQIKLTGDDQHIFLTKGGERMNPDHYREVVWKKALDKAGIPYRPPIQTRHTFATHHLAQGENIHWVKEMMGHSSLQMLLTRYWRYIPKKRKDGSLFLDWVRKNYPEAMPDDTTDIGDNVIYLFGENGTKTVHPKKKAHSE